MTLRSFAIAFALTLGAPFAASAATIYVDIDARTEPWEVGPSHNLYWGFGIHDGFAPVSISNSSGIGFGDNQLITIDYVSGLTSAFSGTPPYAGPSGDPAYVANNALGSSGFNFPSAYINTQAWPVNLIALIGVFASSDGTLVGLPFAVGSSLATLIPPGATRLLLGFNDDIFADNTGSLYLMITGPDPSPVPLPGALWLLASGLAALTAGLRRKRI